MNTCGVWARYTDSRGIVSLTKRRQLTGRSLHRVARTACAASAAPDSAAAAMVREMSAADAKGRAAS